jgi:hypothetical protein
MVDARRVRTHDLHVEAFLFEEPALHGNGQRDLVDGGDHAGLHFRGRLCERHGGHAQQQGGDPCFFHLYAPSLGSGSTFTTQ